MLAVKHSPEVARILQKGVDITTSEIHYLFRRDLDVAEIAKHTKLEITEITECRKNLMKPERKRRTNINRPKFDLTVQQFEQMRADKITKKKIAEMYGVDTNVLRMWEIEHGLLKPDMKGLTKEKYIEHKKAGMWDGQIAKQYVISLWTLTGWRDLHFTKEDMQEMKK